MFHRYDYEAEFYPEAGPLALDDAPQTRCHRRQISLKDWLSFSLEERTVLCTLPCIMTKSARSSPLI
jgi:hypothetical protein